MGPIDPMVLEDLEKQDPGLVAKYRQKMMASDAELKDAQSAKNMAGYAGVAGQLGSDFINSQRSDTVLHNRMQDLGKAPTIQKADRYQWDNSLVDGMADQKMKSARQNREDSVQGMMTEEKLRMQDQSNAEQAMLRDPKSEQSVRAREALSQMLPGISKELSNFDTLSAAQADRLMPMFKDKWQANQRSEDRRFQMAEGAKARSSAKESDRAWKEEQTEKANLEKKKTILAEVEDRRTNIDQNLTLLDKMIEDKGTYEALGSHNQDLDRLVEQIATDMAKLMDPSSVARPSEVEAVKKSLVQSGFQNRNSTARDIIKNFRKEVENRANNAYKIRGIEAPGSNEDAEAMAWAEANPNDPRAQMILEQLKK